MKWPGAGTYSSLYSVQAEHCEVVGGFHYRESQLVLITCYRVCVCVMSDRRAVPKNPHVMPCLCYYICGLSG
jgi:hypothetical protein